MSEREPEVVITRAGVDLGAASAVVRDQHRGPLLPTAHEEVDREVAVENGGSITGPVHCRDLTVDVGGSIRGPVMARKRLVARGASGARTRFGSEVACAGAIEMTAEVADGGSFPVTVDGNVQAKKVRLKGVAVRGHVVAEHVVLEDCFVTGLVVATSGRVELQNVSAFAVHAEGGIRARRTRLFHPLMFTRTGMMDFEPIPVIGFDASEHGGPSLVLGPEDLQEVTAGDDRDPGTYLEATWRLTSYDSFREHLLKAYAAFEDQVADAL